MLPVAAVLAQRVRDRRVVQDRIARPRGTRALHNRRAALATHERPRRERIRGNHQDQYARGSAQRYRPGEPYTRCPH
jgi:hypothetical protein